MKKVSDNILYIVVAVLVGIVIHMYLNDDSEDLNAQVAKYKESVKALEEEIIVQEKRTDRLISRRDSIVVRLFNKEQQDKKVIHEKFEKERADILVLTDDESVQLLSKNIKGI
tara:strand:+ start:2076 stop:2414 length:339 start_codon:yes stop_codon:yes gene_type:complete